MKQNHYFQVLHVYVTENMLWLFFCQLWVAVSSMLTVILLFLLGENRTTVPLSPTLPHLQEQTQQQEECESEEGLLYRGTLSVTVSGDQCLPWASEKVRQLSDSKNFLDEVPLVENYCRNPDDDEEGVWCYVDHPNMTYNYCNLNYCGEEQTSISVLTEGM